MHARDFVTDDILVAYMSVLDWMLPDIQLEVAEYRILTLIGP